MMGLTDEENECRIRRVHKSGGSRSVRIARRNPATRGGISKAGRSQPPQARTEEKGQAFFFGPRGRVLKGFDRFCFFHLTRQFRIGQPLANNLANQVAEAVSVFQGLAIVEAKRLLVNITEQMEGFDRDIGAVQGTFQQAPEILQSVGVNVAVYISHGVVDDLVSVFGLQSKVRLKFAGEDIRSS